MVKMSMTRASKGNGSKVASGTSQSIPTIAPTAFSENTSLRITNHKLNGKNFLQWSKSVEMVICGKGRMGYLDGTILKPSGDDPSFSNWDTQNHGRQN